MDYFIDSGELGNDRNSGTHRRSPRKTFSGAMALSLKDKDRLLIRQGSTFTTPLAWAFNGVTLTSYTLGTEKNVLPTLTLPFKGTKGLTVTGKDNTFEQLHIVGAETGVFVDPLATGNVFTSVNVSRFGWGYLVHGSYTTLNDFEISTGVMVRNVTSEDYVGASAITLWKHEKYECENIRISGGVVKDAWAWRIPKEGQVDTDGDGCIVEIFGGVKHAYIEDVEGLASKILVEVGGTQSRKETTSDVRFVRCKTSGPSGKCFFVNDPLKTFAIAWEGYSFEDCDFQADGYPESPFFFSGNHGDLSTKLSITNSTIVGAAQLVNGGEGTLLETFVHTGNTFSRSDGNRNLGFKLHPTDRLG